MKTKILAVIALLAIAGALIWIVPVLRNRYFNSPNEESGQIENTIPNQENVNLIQNEENTNNTTSSSTEETNVIQNNSNIEIPSTENATMFANITPEHCRTNCNAFSSDLKFFEYCQEVCGLRPVTKNSDCEKEKDLYKDYCFKNMAIAKSDMNVCSQVVDAGIRKACQNRIAEDLVEKQIGQ